MGEKSANSNLEKQRSFQQKAKLVAHSTAMESIQATSDPVDIPHELQGGMPARNHKGERILIFVGIIDILQSYRLSKKLEHTFKAIIHDGDTVSVHRPDFYAKRFMNFMSTKIFKKIPSSLKHSPSKKTKALKVKGGQASGQSSASGTSPPEKISQLGTEGRLNVSKTPQKRSSSVGPFPSATPRPDVVPDSWSGPTDASLPDVRLEPRPLDSSLSRSTLDTPSKLSTRGTPTPTWTEGTPSYTDSTYSGDALPDTPARSLDIEDFSGAGVGSAIAGEGNAEVGKLDLPEDKEPYHETEMTRL